MNNVQKGCLVLLTTVGLPVSAPLLADDAAKTSRVRNGLAIDFEISPVDGAAELTLKSKVQDNPEQQRQLASPRVKFLLDQTPVTVGTTATVRFSVLGGRDDTPQSGIPDLRLRYFQAQASRPLEAAAQEVAPGIYESRITLEKTGAYYLHVGAASLRMDFGQQPYASLRVIPQKPATSVSF